MRKSWKRSIAWTAGVWLLIGAACTVAVAWGVSGYESSGWGETSRRIENGDTEYSSGPWPSGRPAGWPDDPNPPIYEAAATWITCRMWVTLYPAPDGTERARSAPSRVQRWEVGWPLKSMAWEVWSREGWDGVYQVVPVGRWREGVTLGGRTYFGAGMPRVPLMAEWWKFAVNATVWGGALWMVSGGVRRWRRRWREERGRCARCGYDRKGLGIGVVCPECGREG